MMNPMSSTSSLRGVLPRVIPRVIPRQGALQSGLSLYPQRGLKIGVGAKTKPRYEAQDGRPACFGPPGKAGNGFKTGYRILAQQRMRHTPFSLGKAGKPAPDAILQRPGHRCGHLRHVRQVPSRATAIGKIRASTSAQAC